MLSLRALYIFLYNFCHHNFWALWRLSDARHIWHLQYARPNPWASLFPGVLLINTKGTEKSSLSYDTSLSSCLLTDLLIFQSASCAYVFFSVIFIKHSCSLLWKHAVSDHNTLWWIIALTQKRKHLIDFSFTLLTSGGTIVSACTDRGPLNLRELVVSLWRDHT